MSNQLVIKFNITCEKHGTPLNFDIREIGLNSPEEIAIYPCELCLEEAKQLNMDLIKEKIINEIKNLEY